MKLTFTEPLCWAKRQRFLKTGFLMRVGFFYTVSFVCSVQLLLAHHDGRSQGIESTFVTIEMKNEELKSLIEKVEKQTDIRFLFFADQIGNYKDISLPKEQRSVKQLLDIVIDLEPTLTYTQVGKNLIIIKEKSEDPKQNEELKKSVEVPYAFAIKGIVKDASTQEPLAGVNIIVKGTTKGTTTDANGKYVIDAEEHETLVFTFIGFVTFETQIGGRSVIDVAMEGDITSLKEIVVKAGYWDVKEKERTGNISRVTAEDIQKQPVANPLQTLQGRMPGVYIQQKGGVPGASIGLQIRGRNSLRTDGNDPLYIVDGVPFASSPIQSDLGTIVPGVSPFNNIDPMDVESIEVLKDADATAIYGSRGANGVVLITTKKGKAGATKVDINAYTGVGKVTRMMNLLNTQQYLEMRDEAFSNDAATPKSQDYDVNGTWDKNRYTDWQKILIGGTARRTNINTSISGGSESIQFALSGSYYHETTVYPGDFGYKRGSFNFNLNHTSDNKKFNVVFLTSYSADNNNLPSEDPTVRTIRLAPNAPSVYDSNGELNWENSTWENPFATLRRTYQYKTEKVQATVMLGYEILPGLKVKSNLGLTNLRMKEISKEPISSYDPAFNPTGTLRDGNSGIKTWVVEPQIEYQKTVADGTLSTLIGTTFQESIQTKQYFYGYGYTDDALLENILSAPNLTVVFDNYSQYRYNALFARLNYNWKGKYIVNLTGRRDGSSRFGPGQQFANFGAVGVAWVFSSEDFIRNNIGVLSFGKLRASYGITGSDQIGNYAYLDSYSATTPYQGTSLIPTRLANPDYAWEENKKIEAAIDLGFADDKFLISASWYRNRSSNQLVGQSLPAITGFTSYQANFPATVQNTGWEFLLTVNNLKRGNLNWTASLNLTVPKNKLVSYPGIETSSYRNTYVVGESLFTTKKNHYLGVDPQTGVYTFEDVNGDGVGTTTADRRALKKIGQDFFGGFQNSLSFRGFELSVFVQFVKQYSRNYMYAAAFSLVPGRMQNQPSLVMDRWKQEGDVTNVQKFTQKSNSPAGSAYSSSRSSGDNTVSNSSFVRLQNVQLSWRMPTIWVHKVHLQNCRIYIQGQNLITITDYLGFDPENGSADVMPPLRIIATGIQITL